jgi:hypothetical protein
VILSELLQQRDEVLQDLLALVASLDSVDDTLQEILRFSTGNNSFDSTRLETFLEQVCSDAASTSKDSAFASSTGGFVEVLEHMESGDIYHTDKWNIATTLLHVLLIGMSSVAGTDYEIRFGSDQVLSHEIERRAAIFPGAENASVSIGHLRVELDKRMDVRLISLSSIL